MEYVLQVCQFVLTLIEIGMCYAFCDLLIGKNKLNRFSKILEISTVVIIGFLLYLNRVTTFFMSNVFYIAQSLLLAISTSVIYKERYSDSLSITLAYFVGVGLIHIVCLLCMLLLVKEERFFSEIYNETGGLRIVVMFATLLIIGIIYKLFLHWKKETVIRIYSIKKVLLLFGFFGWWTIAWGQTQILKLGSQWAIWSLGTVVFTLGTLVGSFYLFYKGVKKDIEISTIQMRSHMLNNYYDDIRSISEHCLYTTHDMKNHILVLKNYAKKGDTEKVRDYLENIGNPFDEMNQYVWSENETVNLIINTKIKEAKKKNIYVDTEIESVDFPLNDNELCSVFANILDNAVEACENIHNSKRWIRVCITVDNNCLIVKITNSISEMPKKNKDMFVSGKTGHMGYGLKSVAAIIEKYDGMMECDFDKDSFSTKIILRREV